MWPDNSAQWLRPQVLIVSADRDRRGELLSAWSDAHILVATTPLEAIQVLEVEAPAITLVVLSDVVGSVTCAELKAFLEERYPRLRVIRDRASVISRDRLLFPGMQPA